MNDKMGLPGKMGCLAASLFVSYVAIWFVIDSFTAGNYTRSVLGLGVVLAAILIFVFMCLKPETPDRVSNTVWGTVASAWWLLVCVVGATVHLREQSYVLSVLFFVGFVLGIYFFVVALNFTFGWWKPEWLWNPEWVKHEQPEPFSLDGLRFDLTNLQKGAKFKDRPREYDIKNVLFAINTFGPRLPADLLNEIATLPDYVAVQELYSEDRQRSEETEYPISHQHLREAAQKALDMQRKKRE